MKWCSNKVFICRLAFREQFYVSTTMGCKQLAAMGLPINGSIFKSLIIELLSDSIRLYLGTAPKRHSYLC